MSNDTANLAFTKLENTQSSPLEIDSSVTTLALKGNDAAIVVDSTSTIDVILTSSQLLQAAATQLVIDNETGSATISLQSLPDATSTANSRAAQLQSVLKLGAVGSTAKLTFIRNGAGTSIVNLEGTQILGLGQTYAHVLVEATNVTAGAQTNTISAVGGGDAYIQSTWTPALTGSTSGGATATIDTANYTKIGNVVFFSLKMSSIVDVDLTGNVQISLPTTVAAGENPSFTIGNIEPYTYSDTNAEQIIARAVAGTNLILLQSTVTGSATAALTNADFFGATSVTDLQISGHYVSV